MENFDDAIKYSTELLKFKNTLRDITNETKATNARTGAGDAAIINFLNSDNNPENIWAFNETGISDNIYTYTRFLGTARIGYYFRISSLQENNLMSMYEFNSKTFTGDRRALYWFSFTSKGIVVISPFNYYNCLKYDRSDKSSPYLYQQMFRVGEAYLILAESYARKQSPDINQSLNFLNQLRTKRIKPYTNLSSADFANSEELIKFIWDERRRELCFEECFRWWDLRRTGQPSLKHVFTEGSSNQIYKLTENDPAYILNFPLSEREFSSLTGDLIPNARPDRNPEQ
jgi:SusD family.